MKNQKNHRKHKTGARALLFGTIFSAITFLVVNFVFAVIASRLDNPNALLIPGSLIALFSTSAISSFVKYKGDGGIYPAMLSSLMCVLILFLIGVIISHGALPLFCVINLLSYLGISFIFALIANKRPTRHTHRR